MRDPLNPPNAFAPAPGAGYSMAITSTDQRIKSHGSDDTFFDLKKCCFHFLSPLPWLKCLTEEALLSNKKAAPSRGYGFNQSIYLESVHKVPFTALRLPENYSFTQVNCVFSGFTSLVTGTF